MEEETKVIQSVVWGTVTANGREFYLLEPKPKFAWKWQIENTLRWLACDIGNYRIDKDSGSPVYKASHVIFGGCAMVELLDNPQTTILVEYSLVFEGE